MGQLFLVTNRTVDKSRVKQLYHAYYVVTSEENKKSEGGGLPLCRLYAHSTDLTDVLQRGESVYNPLLPGLTILSAVKEQGWSGLSPCRHWSPSSLARTHHSGIPHTSVWLPPVAFALYPSLLPHSTTLTARHLSLIISPLICHEVEARGGSLRLYTALCDASLSS